MVLTLGKLGDGMAFKIERKMCFMKKYKRS
jgi:hypothetical protein